MMNIMSVCREWFDISVFYLWKKVTVKSTLRFIHLLEGLSSPERGNSYWKSFRVKEIEFGKNVWEKLVKSFCKSAVPFFHKQEACLSLDLTVSDYHLRKEVDGILEAIGPNLGCKTLSLKIDVAPSKSMSKFPNLKSLSCPGMEDCTREGVDALLNIVPKLTRLEMCDIVTTDPNLISILEAGVNLATLHLEFDDERMNLFFFKEREPVEVMKALTDPTRTFFPNLKSICFNSTECSEDFVVAFFNRVPKNIEKLDLELVYKHVPAVLQIFGNAEKPNTTLKELKCWGEPLQLLPFAFTALESIELDGPVPESVLMEIASACHATLRRFTMSIGERQHEVLKEFLEICTELEEMFLDGIADARDIVDGLIHPRLHTLQIGLITWLWIQRKNRIKYPGDD